MNDNDLIRLRHMLDAAREAIRFIGGASRSDLDQNRMLVFALTRAIEIVGEAASKISKETQSQTSHIPWPQIIGMRNRIVHAYYDIDLDRLWDTVTISLPILCSQLEQLIPPDEDLP
jgi:uncharacterized protein with HEPN domain